MNKKIKAIADCCLAGGKIDEEQIGILLAEARRDFFDLLYWANSPDILVT